MNSKKLEQLKHVQEQQREVQKERIAELEVALTEANEVCKEAEQENEAITSELDRMHDQVKYANMNQKESEEEVQKLIEELDAAKHHVAMESSPKSDESDPLQTRGSATQKNFRTGLDDNSKGQLDENQKEELERELFDARESNNVLEKEVVMLRTNLERTEQVESQNEELENHVQAMSAQIADAEDLEERLEAVQSNLMHKDKMLCNARSELESLRNNNLEESGEMVKRKDAEFESDEGSPRKKIKNKQRYDRRQWRRR